jgi:hypothetical protein
LQEDERRKAVGEDIKETRTPTWWGAELVTERLIDTGSSENGRQEEELKKKKETYAAVKHVVVLTKRRQMQYVVSYADGCLRVFLGNGTLRYEHTLPLQQTATAASNSGAPALALAAQDSLGVGGMYLLRANSPRPPSRLCELPKGHPGYHSLVYDATHVHVLYAGSCDGELHVYNTRDKQMRETRVMTSDSEALNKKGAAAPSYCTPVSVFPVERGQAINLAVTKGYLFVTSPYDLHVFNVTVRDRFGPSWTMLRQIGERSRDDPILSPSPLFLGTGELGTRERYVGVVDVRVNKNVCFRSLLAWKDTSKPTVGLTRLPMLLGILIVMVIYQVMKKWEGGKQAFDPSDPQFLKHFAEFEHTGGRGPPGMAGVGNGMGKMGNVLGGRHGGRRGPMVGERFGLGNARRGGVEGEFGIGRSLGSRFGSRR